MNNTIYSAAEGPMRPKKYIIEKSPIYPQIVEPKPVMPPQPPQPMETKYVVHYIPMQFVQPVIPKPEPTMSNVELKSTEVLPTETVTYAENPLTVSTLQNIIPRMDELDTMKINKDFDFNTHYELEFKKEINIFPYSGIRKINLPLFGHLELPQEYNYTSPSLSPDNRYLACIARGANDVVFVWDTNNLYCFKYKYTALRVDGFAFTPDSNFIIIVYRFNNPVMYSLDNGEKVRSFEKNGEENNRTGFQYSFSMGGKNFGYTSDLSLTVWNINTGVQRIKIKNKSPFKIICGEYLVCIDENLICSFIKISDGITDLQFKLKGVVSVNDILDCRVSLDMKYLIYIIEQGIIKYNILTQEFQGVQKFKPMSGTIKAVISPDCKYAIKTNMKYLNLYNLETQDTLGTMLKAPFNEYKVDFINKKIITIDDICINIHDYSNQKLPEQFVWLNKNPTHFVDIKFSKDFKIMIGKIDNNNSVVYDCATGKVIRKFQNFEEDYSVSCVIAPTNVTNLTNIVSKSGKHSIFSADGSLLAVGAVNGPQIARVYNINSGQYVTFEYSGNNYNFHTIVNLTSPEPKKLICCSIDQQPLIFNINGELMFKCSCKYHFEEIYEIESDLNYNVFLLKARDTQKRNIALLYRLSDGCFIEKYENYTSMSLAQSVGYLIGKCENLSKNKLTTLDLHNLKRPIRKVCQLQSDYFYFLNDYKAFVSKFGDDENIVYYIGNVENGRIIAKANYSKKSNRNAETHLSVDPIRNELVFRYIELLPFEDTLFYRKQHIDKVNKEENDDEKISFANNNEIVNDNDNDNDNDNNINDEGGIVAQDNEQIPDDNA